MAACKSEFSSSRSVEPHLIVLEWILVGYSPDFEEHKLFLAVYDMNPEDAEPAIEN